MAEEPETRWLTYDALAEALRITPDSARRLAGRHKWPRRPGNDGRALVAVPAERLAAVGPDVPPDVGEDDTPDNPPDVAPDVGGDARALVSYLEARVAELQGEVSGLRAKASEADTLAGRLDSLKDAIDDMRTDRDRWRELAERLAQPAAVAPAPPHARPSILARVLRRIA